MIATSATEAEAPPMPAAMCRRRRLRSRRCMNRSNDELRGVEQRREPLEHVESVIAHADSTALRFISARARVVSERTEEAPMPSISPASSAR